LLLSAVVAEAAARFAEVVDDVPETPLPLLPSDDDVFERFLLEDIFFLLLLFASFSPWALRLFLPFVFGFIGEKLESDKGSRNENTEKKWIKHRISQEEPKCNTLFLFGIPF